MSKKTLILGIVLIALITLAYAYQGPLKKWQNNLGKPNNFLSKINIESIDKVEIVNQDKILTLSKQGEKWKYDNSKDFFVDASFMTRVFDELKKAVETDVELVSNSKDRKSEFKTDQSGMEIKIYQAEKQVSNFVIGSLSGDYASSFISLPESAVTYLVKADLSSAFNPADWRDYTIFSAPAEEINKIRFQYPNREFTIELKDGIWSGVLPNKFTVNTEKVKPILDIMANLRAAEIPEQVFANTGLDKHLIIIEATGEGVDNILMVGGASDALYYAKKGDSDNIYFISKNQRDELDKSSWQLR